MKIRSVIIGCAHMHVNEIAMYIHEQPESELCGIADLPAALPEETQKRYTRAWNLNNIVTNYQAKVYEDYRAMLDAVHPDVAYILCENNRKAEVAEEVAKRGIDVIVEKPMAESLQSAARIAALKEKYHVNVLVNWPVAWRKYVREMKSTLDSGVCGKLKKLRYINGHTGPLGKGARHRGVASQAEEMTDEERSRIWWYRSASGGGAYLDILCYGCYFTRWMFGRLPVEMLSLGENLGTPYGDVEDNVVAIARYEDGFSVCEGTWTTPRRRMTTGPEAICEDGVIWCDGVPDEEAFVSAMDQCGNERPVCLLAQEDRYRNMPWHYAAFRNRGEAICETLTAEFNVDVVAMIEASKRSNEAHRAEAVRQYE